MKFTTSIRWVAYSALLILLYIASLTLFFRIDLTSNKIHSLSKASKQTVSSLEEPLTVKIFLSENLPTPYNNLQQEMSDLMEAYGISGNKFFNYSINMLSSDGIDESEESKSNRSDALSYGISPIQIQKVEADEVKLVSATMGMAFIQGDIIEVIPVLGASGSREFTITATIQKLNDRIGSLLSLEENIQLKLYFSSSLSIDNASLVGYPDSVEAAVQELNSEYYNRLDYVKIDPDNMAPGVNPPDFYSLPVVRVDVGPQDARQTRSYYATLVVENGDAFGTIDLLSRGFFGYQLQDPPTLLEALPAIIDSVMHVNPKVGYLTDNGTYPLYQTDQNTPGLNNLRNLIEESYDLVEVSLANGIPDDVQSVIIASPGERFTEWELFQLDQFLMKGNSLAFFIDSLDQILPQGEMQYYQPPTYEPRESGLTAFLAHHGIMVEESYILDENCFEQTSQTGDGGLTKIPLYFAPIIDAGNINDKIAMMGNIKGLVLLNSSPLTISEEPPSGVTPETLFSSSGTSWEMRDEINLYDPRTIVPPPDESRLEQVAAAVSRGSMTSYFAGLEPPDPLPMEAHTHDGQAHTHAEDPVEHTVATTLEIDPDAATTQISQIESGAGQVFVIGSSTLLKDNVLDANGVSPNATFILNLFDTLNGREEYAVMRSKGQSYNPLNETSPPMKRFVKWFNMAGLPVLVAVFGLMVWLHGISRRKKIELLFNNEGDRA